MSVSLWTNQEMDLIQKLRPSFTTREIKQILDELKFSRTIEAIAKKARMLGSSFQGVGGVDLTTLNKSEKRAVQNVLEIRQEAQEMSAESSSAEAHFLSSYSVNKDGNVAVRWYKSNQSSAIRENALKEALAQIPKIVQPGKIPSFTPVKNASKDLMPIYVVGDPHLGLYACLEETGEEWTLQKGIDYHCAAVRHLVQQGESTEKSLLLEVGDFYHADNASNQTPKHKNPLDVDGRWHKIYRLGVETKILMIQEMLKNHQHVHVICVVGNHDECSAFTLAIALYQRFSNDKRVTVDITPGPYYYYQFEHNLIGSTHGHHTKIADLESIMVHDKPQAVSETLHRLWITGHVHHKTVHEFRNCTVETMRTLIPKDGYHHGKGYRSKREMTKIMLHKEYGEIDRAVVGPQYLRALVER